MDIKILIHFYKHFLLGFVIGVSLYYVMCEGWTSMKNAGWIRGFNGFLPVYIKFDSKVS